MIQQLLNLADAQLEFQVLDRASFQRFIGIRDSGKETDRNTVWAFRERLVQVGLGASLNMRWGWPICTLCAGRYWPPDGGVRLQVGVK